MITYVDTSVLVKLLIDEPGADRARRLWQMAEELATVTLIAVEARAALAATRRGKRLTPAQHGGRSPTSASCSRLGLHIANPLAV